MRKEFYCWDHYVGDRNFNYIELRMRTYYTDNEWDKLSLLARLIKFNNKCISDISLRKQGYDTIDDFIRYSENFLDNADKYEDEYNDGLERDRRIAEQTKLEKDRKKELERLKQCKKSDLLKKVIVRKW